MSDPWSPEFEIAVAANDKTVQILETLELHHSAIVQNGVRTAVRAVNDVKDWTFSLEADAPLQGGQAVEWTAIPFTWGEPSISEGQAPQADVRVDNVERELEPYLDAIETSFEPIVVIYRVYLSNRGNVVDRGPFRFVMKEIATDNGAVSGKVEIATPQNLKFGTRVYSADQFASLVQTS